MIELEEFFREQNLSSSFEGKFDLMHCILNSITENQQQPKEKPVDSNTFLSISETSTKEEFSKALQRFSMLNNVNGRGINNLLSTCSKSGLAFTYRR